eukprot:jgi/Mesen1/5692/ME000288S04901
MAIKVLNVAEKPSVAKAVAQILSHGQYRSREGRSRYNKVFEFGYTIGGQQCNMAMTSVAGHLMEMDFEDQYRKWHSCDPAQLYDLPVRKKVPEDKLALKQTLQEESRGAQWLVLWLDCDREGENIAYEVLDVCVGSNRRLDIFRAHFSALIDRDIHNAVQNLGRPNKRFADAVDARQEIDLKIGASFTRFQTMLLQDSFELPAVEGEARKPVISYGPCQFPTLGFVVERYWQIQAHVPEDFWYIHCSYADPAERVSANFKRGILFDRRAATIIYEICVENPTATVTDVSGQERKKYPPYPLNTVELTKRASRFLRLGSEHTMKVAEELYQAGFISYPRTETDGFPENMDLQAMVAEQQVHPTWGAYARRLLDPQQALWRAPANGGHSDQAHPPIHPTKYSPGESHWSPAHTRVYELVVRHFLACVSQPAVGYGTTAVIDLAGETFRANGLMITAFRPTELMLKQGTTEPPALISEADLIGLMDKVALNRPLHLAPPSPLLSCSPSPPSLPPPSWLSVSILLLHSAGRLSFSLS